MKKKWMLPFLVFALALASSAAHPPLARAQTTDEARNLIVLRVRFADMRGSTYTTEQAQWLFAGIATLSDVDSSRTQNFQITDLYTLPRKGGAYVDVDSPGDASTDAALKRLVGDAVRGAPSELNWRDVHGLVVLFADTRANGSYRGTTVQRMTIAPVGVGKITVPVSVVGEDPLEGQMTAWRKIARQIDSQ